MTAIHTIIIDKTKMYLSELRGKTYSMFKAKNWQLLLSVIIIVPVALAYGIAPATILPRLFNFTVNTTNLVHVFRVIMILYLGMCALWIVGIVQPKYWTTATIANIVFMGSLAAGRCISFIVDGVPSLYFIAGGMVELLLAIWGIANIINSRLSVG